MISLHKWTKDVEEQFLITEGSNYKWVDTLNFEKQDVKTYSFKKSFYDTFIINDYKQNEFIHLGDFNSYDDLNIFAKENFPEYFI